MKLFLKQSLIVVFAITLSNCLFAQLPGFNWAHSYGADIQDMAVNNNNDIYFVGSNATTIGSFSVSGNYLAKKATGGTILWVVSLGFVPNSIALDKAGNVLVCSGSYFYSGDPAVYKYSPAGVLLATHSITITGGTANLSISGSLCTDTSDNYYMVVKYHPTTANTSINGITLQYTASPAYANYRIAVFQFNSAGVFQGMIWSTFGTGSITSHKLKRSPNGTVYLALGYTKTNSGSTYNDYYEFKSINNSTLWATELSPSTSLRMAKYFVDMDFDSSNNIIIATDFSIAGYPFNFGPSSLTSYGSTDIVLLKYDINGNKMVAKNFGSSSVENSNSIEIDNANNIYLTGKYGTGNTNLTIGSQTLVSQGNGDAFLAKLNSNFVCQWAKPIANYGVESAEEIEIDNLGNIIVSGNFNSGTLTLETETFTNQGAYDGFLVKYCTGTPANITSLPKACVNDTSVALTGGSPSGGIYSGISINNNIFNPSIIGAGTYPVTYTYTDGNGCKNFDIDSITVYPQPTVTLSTLPDRCVNASASSLSGGFPSGGTFTGTGVNSNVFNPAIAGVGTYTITYTYTNGNGCSNTAKKPITVNALPGISFNPLAKVCEGTTTVPLSGALPSGGTYSGNGVFSNIFYPSAAGVGVGSHNITYTYQDANGCVNSALQPLTVTPLPTATFTVSPETYVGACDGSLVSIVGGGTGAINTVWTNFTGTVIGFTPSLSGLCPGTYTLTLTDNAGCSKVYSKIIGAGPLPPTVPICLVTADDFSNHNIIIWEKPITTIIDSFRIYRETTANVYTKIGTVHHDSLSLFHDYAANPNVTSYKYKISSVDAAANESPLSAVHRTIHLIVNNGGSQQNLQWNDYEGAPIQYYQVWRDDLGNNIWKPLSSSIPAGGGIVTWSDLTPSANPNSRYYLDVIGIKPCTPTRTTINTTRSNIKGSAAANSVEEWMKNNSVQLYPNPATGAVTIEFPAGYKKYELQVYDMLGQLVYSETLAAAGVLGGISTKQIDVSSFRKGVYTVSVQTENGNAFKRLTIQ